MKKMLIMVLTAFTVAGFAAGCSNTGENDTENTENTGTNSEESTTNNAEE
ncbi:hypothetical protein [Bacillus salacetis]|nr:hypothetical protein [Bacillus salacetis]